MTINENMYDAYFKLRNINQDCYRDYKIPDCLLRYLPKDKNARILDIGCGFGQMLSAINKIGYVNGYGIDICNEAIHCCRKQNINVTKINDIIEFASSAIVDKFDFIIMSHVLEHIEKNMIIETLKSIKSNLLSPKGKILVMVPNAQSNTGCYWAYEDFTHTTIFTAGSLFFVLKAGGFEKITLIDPYCLENLSFLKRIIKIFLLKIYILNKKLWNKITSSSYHDQSPQIFSYDIKVLAE